MVSSISLEWKRKIQMVLAMHNGHKFIRQQTFPLHDLPRFTSGLKVVVLLSDMVLHFHTQMQ